MTWMEWYNSLAKPSWTPAPSTISLIWTPLAPITLVGNHVLGDLSRQGLLQGDVTDHQPGRASPSAWPQTSEQNPFRCHPLEPQLRRWHGICDPRPKEGRRERVRT